VGGIYDFLCKAVWKDLKYPSTAVGGINVQLGIFL